MNTVRAFGFKIMPRARRCSSDAVNVYSVNYVLSEISGSHSLAAFLNMAPCSFGGVLPSSRDR
jgi:hypothetical protein